ncbi:proton channel OTOP3 isoform X2 [Scophthalmus maximus]|uniref:proton channel OTOP3 isoform X2 n=1 Tax=Scophthalmus maximus TaxID=52904 RepID=UPI0015E0DE05|nr:proton channel OTOP3 isoform X2 [Scophthalmus maximus]
MNPDPGASELDSSPVAPGNPTDDQPDARVQDQELDPVLVWVPSGRRLISGLLGMNVVLLGAALVAGRAFNPAGLRHQEPQVFMLLLMVAGLTWMLWFLLWARRQPGISPHKDHHAGGSTVTRKPPRAPSPRQDPHRTYLLWVHSKDCIHRHKIVTRSGLMLILSADLLLWLNAVTEETIHQEIELEKEDGLEFANTNVSEAAAGNWTGCRCSASTACLAFRKGFEILYPFNMEFYLMAGCMVYVMWKNVGRRTTGPGHHATQKLTLRVVYQGGLVYGLVLGGLVLVAGVAVFLLYQVWVSQEQLRLAAFLVFYGYHLAVMPVMSCCSLAGMLVHRLERRAHEGGHNPTRSLDVLLLVAAALGQLALSYFSLVAALALGTSGPLGDLDLAYSVLSLLELVLQNIFIIEGLHRHPNLLARKKEKQRRSIFKPKKKAPTQEERKTDISLLEGNDTPAPPAAQGHDGKKSWHKRAIQEICAFLVLSNIMLWVIPAFGAHPQFENGLGKQFFGFSVWFVLVNLGQPLSVFYRMHSVGALLELLLSA